MSLTTLLSLESTWVFSAETNCSWQQISDCQWEVLLLFSIYLSFWILSHVSLGEEYLTKFTGNSSTIQLHYCWASTSLTHIFPKFLFSKRRLNTWNCFFFWIFVLKSSKIKTNPTFSFFGRHILHDLENFSTLHRSVFLVRKTRLQHPTVVSRTHHGIFAWEPLELSCCVEARKGAPKIQGISRVTCQPPYTNGLFFRGYNL